MSIDNYLIYLCRIPIKLDIQQALLFFNIIKQLAVKIVFRGKKNRALSDGLSAQKINPWQKAYIGYRQQMKLLNSMKIMKINDGGISG
ncbi:hypothetical protein AB7X11_17390 [Providencia alcalifaciens]